MRLACCWLGVLTVLVHSHALALQSDKSQPIQIEADRLDVDEQKGVSTYTGKVQYKQGSIVLSADKLSVRVSPDGRIKQVNAEGSPAVFEQKLERDKQLLRGQAVSVEYFAEENYMVLTGEARISHCGDEFAGGRLEYWSDKELVKASKNAESSKRVQVVLQPRTQDATAPGGDPAAPVCAPISAIAK